MDQYLLAPRELVIQDQIATFTLLNSSSRFWIRFSYHLLARHSQHYIQPSRFIDYASEEKRLVEYVNEVRFWQRQLECAFSSDSEEDSN